MVISADIYVMLLTYAKFKEFTPKKSVMQPRARKSSWRSRVKAAER